MRPSSTRQALAVVPPMSNEITLFSPASLPNSAVASPPPAGPDSSSRIGNLRAASGDTRPPAECIRRNAPANPRADKFALEVRQIAVHQGLHIGVGAGGDGARIFAQFRDHIGGQRDEQVRKFAFDQRARGLLVRRIGIGMQEADRDRFDAVIGKLARCLANRIGIERRDRRARRGPSARRSRDDGGAEPAGRGSSGTDRRCRSAARPPFRGVAEASRGEQARGATPRRSMIALVTTRDRCRATIYPD